MPTLRDHIARAPYVEPRSLALMVAPILRERSDPYRARIVEEAALTVLGAVIERTGVTREQLVLEQRRFHGMVTLIHRLPTTGEGGGS